jgi:mRNA-degrading endonuclease HigB of HigAB toxin-antitoxin module
MILIGREHLAHHAASFPASRTALCLWQATSKSVQWRDQAAVVLTYPTARFTTPQIARFFPAGTACVITTQIAFNTGILIVLAVTEAASAENINHG